MNLYLTNIPQISIENTLSNFSKFAVINVDYVIGNLHLDMNKPHNQFLLNKEIEKFMQTNSNNKRFQGIIYINSRLNRETVTNIMSTVEHANSGYNIDKVILLDNYNVPALTSIYSAVENVMYISPFKRVKIVECKPMVFSE